MKQRQLISTMFALVSSVALRQMVRAASFVMDVRQCSIFPASNSINEILTRSWYCSACNSMARAPMIYHLLTVRKAVCTQTVGFAIGLKFLRH